MSVSLASVEPQRDRAAIPLRIMIVDDSAIMRKILSELLKAEQWIRVVGSAGSGESALDMIEHVNPDVITLDVSMPGMDGIETLKRIRERKSDARVIMISSLTKRGAPETLKALALGASDYCPKPEHGESGLESFRLLRKDLLPKLRQFMQPPAAPGRTIRPMPLRRAVSAAPDASPGNPHVLVIGISTGGPQVLSRLIPTFPADYPLPILIVQHMPALFTPLLAQRLNGESRIQVEEATAGQVVRPGLALIAPGGYHLRVKRSGSEVVTTLDQEPLENSCRPAVDALFRSAAEVWGGRVLAAVLTGMGHDGLSGAKMLKKHGAYVIVQDERSSVVWGMPGAIANEGLADEVLDVDAILPAILKRSGYRQ